MKKIVEILASTLLAICLAIVMVRCNDGSGDQHERVSDKTTNYHFDVIVIEGCQYIKGYEQMAHKGNCNNPIHVYNKLP